MKVLYSTLRNMLCISYLFADLSFLIWEIQVRVYIWQPSVPPKFTVFERTETKLDLMGFKGRSYGILVLCSDCASVSL